MKKLIAIALIATVSFTSCSENKNEETKVDTIDSIMDNKMDSVDNTADSVINVLDSTKDAKIDSVKATN